MSEDEVKEAFDEVVRGTALAEVRKIQYRVSLTVDVHVLDAESAVVEAAQIFRSMLAGDFPAGDGPWFDVADPSGFLNQLQESFDGFPGSL